MMNFCDPLYYLEVSGLTLLKQDRQIQEFLYRQFIKTGQLDRIENIEGNLSVVP